jgi:hypothetical protein
VLPAVIPFGLGLVGLRLLKLRLRLLKARRKADPGDFQIDLSAGKLRPCQGEVGLGLVTGGGVVAGIDLQQRVAGMDKCIVIYVELDDIAGDLGRIGDGIALCIGVVGAFQVAG